MVDFAARSRVRIQGDIEISTLEGLRVRFQGAELTRDEDEATLRLESTLGEVRHLADLLPDVAPLIEPLDQVAPEASVSLTLRALPGQAERLAHLAERRPARPWEHPAWLGALMDLSAYEPTFAGLVAEG